MLVYAGIDEAGYGPMLGPLSVAATVFVLPEHDPAVGAPDLWQLLDSALCRSRRDSRHRIPIDDSKKLKGSKKARKFHPLHHLERGVLAFLTQLTATTPTIDTTLFEQIGADVPDAPWYGSSTSLPIGESLDELHIDTHRLQRTLDRAGIQCASIECRIVDTAALNQQVELLGKKSAVNLGVILQHIDAIWKHWEKDHPRIIVDRQGGRIHYLRELQLAFPDTHIQILAEDPERSRYRLQSGSTQCTISFHRRAESGHLPVALASMTAKYTRELFMIRLNRFFSEHLPQLQPTAGYVQDARRYLQEITPLINQLKLDRSALIRKI